MANGFDPRRGADLSPAAAELLARRDKVLGPSYRLFYDRPVDIARAEGVRLFDHDGVEYLDAYNNVPVIGHSHPKVRDAISAQLRVVNTHTRYLTEPIIDYSERLVALFPEPLSRVTYACTGSEAIDLAVRIARFHTGKRGVIITQHAYHGTTIGAAGMSPSLGPNNQLGAEVVTIPSPDTARTAPGAIAETIRRDVREAIARLESAGHGVAALVLDSVLSSDGTQVEPAGFLAGAAKEIRRAGGLYIADEVQPGFARTGEWWGFRRHGFIPDLVVLGKPMGNGIPISAVVGSPEVQEAFGSQVRYFNTFGGNPVSIAAAGAVLDVIEEEDLRAHATEVGERLTDGLEQLRRIHARIFDVRGAGLFIAAELGQRDDPSIPDSAFASSVVNGMRERRILISVSGPSMNVLKIRPPLPFSADDADRLIETLDIVLKQADR
ncbi:MULTISPECIES: aspartate aminotransferase family protein [unclassified Streptomyces]|uniref:aspartate aminotransferase family protein n=1 Tax=unclassified Streptomyces TaxID=2593676 RepID=UPI002E365C8F|nr:aspartate aminotransferase family protein [Streptomyces sp. NBC_01361]